jgi:hypothetical protein
MKASYKIFSYISFTIAFKSDLAYISIAVELALRNIVTCGLKAATCASTGRSFARHVLVVTQNTSLLWVLMEPLETYPW